MEPEARKLRKERDNFLRIIADGKAPESVLAEIKRREDRLAELQRHAPVLRLVKAA